MVKRTAVVLVVLLLLSFSIPFVRGALGEIDKVSVVDWVEDGDTFNVTSGETIRLADVNTPERDKAGYSEAKSFMINLLKLNLLEGKTVYLDIDDITRTDPYDRLVCVVYFDYNSTHYMNVNKALLEYGYAVEWDFSNNEFSPSTWSLYVPKNAIPEFPFPQVLIALFATILIGTLLCKRKGKSAKVL